MTAEGGKEVDDDLKRKTEGSELERWICLLFHSLQSPKAVALFELKINIFGKDVAAKQDGLELIEAFYDQRRYKRTYPVGCARLGSSGGSYLLMPGELDPVNSNTLNVLTDYEKQYPCIFNPVTKDSTYLVNNHTLALKVSPFAMTVGNKVYVLACRNAIQFVLSDPSFEAYDTVNEEWQRLPTPFFNKNIPSIRGWEATGYAVYGTLILVALENTLSSRQKCAIHSYNTLTGDWKPVPYNKSKTTVFFDDGDVIGYNHRPLDEFDHDYRIWTGEAFVINDVMYSYIPDPRVLVSYSCCTKVSEEGNDDDTEISFGDEIYVECSERRDWSHLKTSQYLETGCIGKIGEDLICMIKTIYKVSANVTPRQPVLFCILRVLDGGRCTKLRSLDLYMPGSEQFELGIISSCFLLQPQEVSSTEHGERSYGK